mmetsp:Transcript_21074/g.31196  ORF Transcript_21074/g.31196 Transcript_21074/m.31196 type:complete len:373 (+) Transcript_21074:142-1260(+)
MPVRVVIREPTNIPFPIPIPSRSLHHSTSALSPSSRVRGKTINDVLNKRNETLEEEDIYASTRLSGYLFIVTAYCVLFVSAFKDAGEDKNAQDTDFENAQGTDFDSSNLKSLQCNPDYADSDLKLTPWKVSCTVYGSLAFMITTITIVTAHYDGFLIPGLWRCLFKVGGKGEILILSLMMGFGLFIVYCSTSSTGLGGFAGLNYNVYFSSWAGLAATIYTFDLWLKDSAKVLSIGERKKKSDGTTYSWACTLIFSIITLLSLLDMFLVAKMLTCKASLIMLLSCTASAGCCIFVLLMNACCNSDKNPWHLLEGLLSFLLSSFWTWVVFRFTGINGTINEPSNNYFGVWGSFFYSISTFGIWLKGHKLFCGSE